MVHHRPPKSCKPSLPHFLHWAAEVPISQTCFSYLHMSALGMFPRLSAKSHLGSVSHRKTPWQVFWELLQGIGQQLEGTQQSALPSWLPLPIRTTVATICTRMSTSQSISCVPVPVQLSSSIHPALTALRISCALELTGGFPTVTLQKRKFLAPVLTE